MTANSDFNFRAAVWTERQFKSALENEDIERVYAPFRLLTGESFSQRQKEKIIVQPPVFIGGDEAEMSRRLEQLKNDGFTALAVNTLDTLEMGESLGYTLHGGFRLNVTNSEAAKMYCDMGLSDITLSIELNVRRIRGLNCDIKKGAVVYGRLPVMLTRRCPIKDGKACGKSNCNKTLIDRKGNELKVICDTCAHVLNPHILNLSDKLGDFYGCDFLTLLFTDEEDIGAVVAAYKKSEKPAGEFTRGLYYK